MFKMYFISFVQMWLYYTFGFEGQNIIDKLTVVNTRLQNNKAKSHANCKFVDLPKTHRFFSFVIKFV